MDRVDAIVVGAGVVGLACARALALKGLDTILIEQSGLVGSETSSRNSEVIHAGIYYPTDSLKANLCVQGKHLLYDYLEERKIPYERCKKLIVATTPDEVSELENVKLKAGRNGVSDLEIISKAEAQALESELHCLAAIKSPSTGIIDSHAYMLSLLGDFEMHGGTVCYHTKVTGVDLGSTKRIATISQGEHFELETQLLVNCGGLSANSLAHSISGFPREHIPDLYYAKGNYFSLKGRSPFKHLIYPLPVPGGLGVHFTKDLSARGRFGPDVEWIDKINYEVDHNRAISFYAAIRKYWPGLPDGYLLPDYSGIRPKLVGAGEKNADFCISTPVDHGINGITNLFGIESPGLTASLAIGDYVARHA